MAENRTVLVTGGAGWIGLRTVPLLLERGYRVRILDSMVRGDREAVTRLAEGGDVELVEQDVRYGGAVHQAMRGATHVLHYAAVSINKGSADPYESVDVNLVGSHNVFAAAADHGVRRLVFASSASVYGDPERLPMSEDGPLRPAHAVLHQQAGRGGPARLLPASVRAVVDRAAVLQRLRARAEDQRLLHLGDQPLRRPAPRR